MIEDNERFDPSRHTLDDAAKRLKEISEKDYTARLAEVLGRHEDQGTERMNEEIVSASLPMTTSTVLHVGASPWAYTTSGDGPRTPTEIAKRTGMKDKDIQSEEFEAQVEKMPAILTPEHIDELMSKQRIRVAPEPMRYIPSEDEIRAMIREEVHRALYPSAEMANPHEHRRIEMVEEDGRKWRGVLYLVEKEGE